MPPLDAATLLMVIAVIDAVACVVWLALGEALRIAPRASRRISAYHGLLALAWWPTLPDSMERLVALPLDLVSAGLLTAGVRALTRVRDGAWDIVAIVGLGLVATAFTAGDPDLATARAISNLVGGVLALMAAWTSPSARASGSDSPASSCCRTACWPPAASGARADCSAGSRRD
ncbi:hypothetical protein ACFJIX_06840 [Roseateles sp. UC29_93]|uniref:hypothetical protein n=1 Tax=Roseateles sp. UC29_93 TaxID=3350177 RepID=UPI0036712B90